MILETILISSLVTIGTNILLELIKYITKKSKCKIKMELGDKSDADIFEK